jgi:hypothetical protein
MSSAASSSTVLPQFKHGRCMKNQRTPTEHASDTWVMQLAHDCCLLVQHELGFAPYAVHVEHLDSHTLSLHIQYSDTHSNA